MRRRFIFLLPLLLVSACEAPAAEEDAVDSPTRTPPGKADLFGSCEGSDCDGPSPDGNCYCDESCLQVGDCCADRGELCGLVVEPKLSTLAAGSQHTCAVVPPDGGIKCWGANNNGQLGDGTRTRRATPVGVFGLTRGAVAVTAGGAHTCALTEEGNVLCWGANPSGQLGDGTKTDRLTPVTVRELGAGVVWVAAGQLHTCAITGSGGAKCWGENGQRQLGNGGTSDRPLAVNVLNLANGLVAATVGSSHSCAVTNDGGVKCWGLNNLGQLGNGTSSSNGGPTDVVGFRLDDTVVSVGSGDHHNCVVTAAGAARCWGHNNNGQIGDGTSSSRVSAVEVSGLPAGAVEIAGGIRHSCAITTAGSAMCWGDNASGQLANGETSDQFVPGAVTGLTEELVDITAGSSHTCARTVEGELTCWGANANGQLGDGTFDVRVTPVKVLEL